MPQENDAITDRADTLLKEGAKALADGLVADAVDAFQQALEILPNYAPANHNMGLIRLRQGKLAEAEDHLRRAAEDMPSVETFTQLGRCYEKMGRVKKALYFYAAVLDKKPDNADLWSTYGTLMDMVSQTTESKIAFEKCLALDPRKVSAALALSWILWREQPSQAIELLEHTMTVVAGDTRNEARILGKLVLFYEWSERVKAGLPPYHARSLDELFFRYATDTLEQLRSKTAELVHQDNTDYWAQMSLGLAEFALGNMDATQRHFTTVFEASGQAHAGATRFDESFFENFVSATVETLCEGLVPVEIAKKTVFEKDNILYMACDGTYFDAFAQPLLLSLNDMIGDHQVHIHLMDSTEEHTESALKFCDQLKSVSTAVTVERPDLRNKDITAKRAYFHAIRFVRFYMHLLDYNKTLWLMDVDGLFHRTPQEIFSAFKRANVAMRVRPGRLEPWNQFNACLVGVKPHDQGLQYIRNVCAYIMHFQKKGIMPWGIDQLAMFACFHNLDRQGLAPKVHLLDERALDYEFRDDGILWCSSGTKKHSTLNLEGVDNDPNATAYDKEFARYSALTHAP